MDAACSLFALARIGKDLCKLTELPDVHNIVFIFQDRSLVVVYIQIVRCAKDGHDTRKTCGPSLAVHAITSVLSFVRPDN